MDEYKSLTSKRVRDNLMSIYAQFVTVRVTIKATLGAESARMKIISQTGVWHARRAEIEQVFSQGLSMVEIAKRFGVSRERIRVA